MTALLPKRFRALVLALLAIGALLVAQATGLDGGLIDAVAGGIDEALFTDADGSLESLPEQVVLEGEGR